MSKRFSSFKTIAAGFVLVAVVSSLGGCAGTDLGNPQDRFNGYMTLGKGNATLNLPPDAAQQISVLLTEATKVYADNFDPAKASPTVEQAPE